MDRKGQAVPAEQDEPEGVDVPLNRPIHIGQTMSGRVGALHQPEYLASEQGHVYMTDREYPPDFIAPGSEPPVLAPAIKPEDRSPEQAGGGHNGSKSSGDGLLGRHVARHDLSELGRLDAQRAPTAQSPTSYIGSKSDNQIAALEVFEAIGEMERGSRRRRAFSSGSPWMLVAVLAPPECAIAAPCMVEHGVH